MAGMLWKLLGLLVTLISVLIITVCAPVYLVVGVIGFVKRKSRRWTYENGCCTHQWPICGSGPEIAGMILTGNVDLDALNDGLQRVVVDSRSNLHKNPACDIHSNLGKRWDQSSYQLTGDADLLELPQQKNVLPLRQTTLSLISEFSHSLKFAVGGPFSLLTLAVRGQNAVWKHLESMDRVPSRNRRRPMTFSSRGSSSVLMESNQDDGTADSKSPTHNIHRGSSLLRNVPTSTVHRRCWMTVKHPELLLRAEKLLRASTSELFISLIAGAIRNYFRMQGILHPPDLAFVAPCSSRGPTPVGERCETNLLSFHLPTSVEGAIPRLWAVQKSIAKVMSGPMPGAVSIFQTLARSCLPTSVAKCVFRVVYRSHAVYFAFYRVNSCRIGQDASIRTVFVFPSLSTSVRAAFVFVQHAAGIDATVSLCSRTFPEPHLIIDSFQTSAMNETLANNTTDKPDQDHSLEELYKLLDDVQNELDGMRSNPEVVGLTPLINVPFNS
ncbi:unnamed protein product [Nippostrongylus brasiliensis]|uniref:Uncharacterized protein n=1 Tax=Nippostrongylus brasiliensis TaxID=27835 RepID=A0A158R1L4_NIPBR|nr:unnamed protein product [Nippostrongylus brasiliensis]